jgi:hypothetical protein
LRPLIPNDEAVVEPQNPSFNNKVRPPTVEQRDAGKFFAKHNFDEQFDIPMYATTDKAHQQRRGRDQYVIKNGKRVPVYEEVIRKKGIVDPNFMKKHKISRLSKCSCH